MLGPLHQNEHFFEGPTPPLLKLNFPPYGREGFAFLGASGEHFLRT